MASLSDDCSILTAVRVHPVDGVVLWVERVLQMELGVLQHPLYDVLNVDGLRHVRRRHDVEGRETGVGRLGHSLHDEVSPQSLLILCVMVLTLQMEINFFF